MEWTPVRKTLGVIGVSSGGVALWLAFERQMCLGSGGCAPNIVYLVPGILALLLGIGLIQLRFLTLVSGFLAASTTLYSLFALFVQGEPLFIGLLILVVALLFGLLALGAEKLRAYYRQRQQPLIDNVAKTGRRRVGWLGVGVLISGIIGYLLGGQQGAITVIAAIGLSVGTLAVLIGVIASQIDSSVILLRPVVVAGVGLLFSLLVGFYYGLSALPDAERAILVATGTILVGLFAGYRSNDHAITGVLHGVLIGGGTGVLFVFIAAHQSFSMQPALDVIVLISGVVAPLIFGAICGVSSGVGSLLRTQKRATQ